MEELFKAIGLRNDISQIMLIGTLMMMRVLPIIFQTPFLGGRMVPPESRIGISLGLTILMYPLAKDSMPSSTLDINPVVYIALMFKELFLGYVIGFIATELFYAMEVAGRTLDTLRGSNMAEVQVPELQMRASPIGQFNFQLLLVVFCAVNGHGYFIESIGASFEVVPIDQFPAMKIIGFETFIEHFLKYSAGLFAIAFALVFPGAFAAFVVDVVFGMFNRIAPQLNAYFMAMGIKAMAGLGLFMFAMTLMVGQFAYHLETALLFIRRMVQFMG
jgi:flagellar biosynthetic protein FliR